MQPQCHKEVYSIDPLREKYQSSKKKRGRSAGQKETAKATGNIHILQIFGLLGLDQNKVQF
jgi:hypothetical protein